MQSKTIFTVTIFDTDPSSFMTPWTSSFSSRSRAMKFFDDARQIINSADTTLRVTMDSMPLDDTGYLEDLRAELLNP